MLCIYKILVNNIINNLRQLHSVGSLSNEIIQIGKVTMTYISIKAIKKYLPIPSNSLLTPLNYFYYPLNKPYIKYNQLSFNIKESVTIYET